MSDFQRFSVGYLIGATAAGVIAAVSGGSGADTALAMLALGMHVGCAAVYRMRPQ